MPLDIRLGRRPTEAKDVLRNEGKVLGLALGGLLLCRHVRTFNRGKQSMRTRFYDKGGAVREVNTESLLVGSEDVGDLSSVKLPGEMIRSLRWHDDFVVQVFGCRA